MSSVVGPLTAAAANALQQQLLSNQTGSLLSSNQLTNPYTTTRTTSPNDAYMSVEIKFIENGFVVCTGMRSGEATREVFCADLGALGTHMQAVVAARQLDRSMK